ncbi:50S ribosomal protein L2 [candidate division WWE3 bacterium CG06_land_8_20_14_3_00_42_16]|uniref:Large ribosomal subunit protein uL2 n=4 Tax=Katanobacteria TaxID=422282 RepID=A0A2M7AMM0_UNCKA|nr:MAG: 50S ribosomal protein L2 [bacterium CG1_02_42_9]PIU68641.1 MAG: 50S ribosomal protein L2 [candidate division WWE3 bacterium CG06_land_8_20_14_3_00_42_16]PIZ43004.1 MAG: 50S ribosomal protein L2 [candidate division WWE3 bacterium CG_4_10_14_0_2_um_filter_42_8]PJA37984.1 MAG: 50S ribosomal protein L2 [candidate division WWE3 bacterium CG_4_9_14_3_um_filter_43_9]PJC69362.1 MAG: 50S ribosomal protein L2 [candidate division WWE3 bacterium CG_4_8_14_3_um_filter_42_11]
MAIKRYRPTTAGQRQKTGIRYDMFTAKDPEKKLTRPLPKVSARGMKGRITVRHHGGRRKRLYRVVDFRRDKINIKARVAEIEYDPNRTAFIALLNYFDGEKRYILSPEGIKVGDILMSGEEAEIKTGNALPLSKIPAGSIVHNIELEPGQGAKMVRSAGSSAVLMSKEGKYAQLKMPSGEIRLVLQQCLATLGALTNPDHKNIKLGKAGRSRWLGRKPKVRGVAMHPNAHPHGGGEGRSGTGMPPKTPWGKRAFGKTRQPGKKSDRLIVKRRK